MSLLASIFASKMLPKSTPRGLKIRSATKLKLHANAVPIFQPNLDNLDPNLAPTWTLLTPTCPSWPQLGDNLGNPRDPKNSEKPLAFFNVFAGGLLAHALRVELASKTLLQKHLLRTCFKNTSSKTFVQAHLFKNTCSKPHARKHLFETFILKPCWHRLWLKFGTRGTQKH